MDNCPHCQKPMEFCQIDEDAPEMPGKSVYVCHNCSKIYQACEVYSRVVGYLRPTSGWNKGKKEEFIQRKEYKLEEKPNEEK